MPFKKFKAAKWLLLSNSSPQAKKIEDFPREMAFKIEI